jgi:hypothetical protein
MVAHRIPKSNKSHTNLSSNKPTYSWAATVPHNIDQHICHYKCLFQPFCNCTLDVFCSNLCGCVAAHMFIGFVLLKFILGACCSKYVGHSEMNINEFLNKSKWYNEPPPFCCRWAMSYSETAPVCIATSIYKGFSLSVYIYKFFSIRSADLLSY